MEMQGAVALVTGGTGGLGGRICHALAQAGCQVAFVYRASHDQAQALADDLATYHGRRGLPLVADLTDPATFPGLLAEIEGAFGRLDILVNNAAANRWVPYPDLDALTPELWDELLGRNLTSPFLLSRAAAPCCAATAAGASSTSPRSPDSSRPAPASPTPSPRPG
ncbi:MAG: SDR family NAD(P)-dependent oxidoreductase [Thermomicrobiales bacterium]